MEDVLEYEVDVQKSSKDKSIQKNETISIDSSGEEISGQKTLPFKNEKTFQAQDKPVAKRWIYFGLGIAFLILWISLSIINSIFITEAITSSVIIGILLLLKTLSPEPEEIKF